MLFPAAIDKAFDDVSKYDSSIQEINPIKDLEIPEESKTIVSAIADTPIVFDASVQASFFKVGISHISDCSRQIDSSYFHAGGVLSTPSVLPISFSVSIGIPKNVFISSDYEKSFLNFGFNAIYGYDHCYWPGGSSANSFTIGLGYGAYIGYDYYWLI